MKRKYINSILNIIALGAISLFPACSSDDDVRDRDPSQLILLENAGASWLSAGGSVVKDDFDVSDQFVDFKLTISGNDYSTENSLTGVWASKGTWSFKDDQTNILERNDGILLRIESISSSQLVLSFEDPNGTGGRYSSLPGDYLFTLVSE